MSVTAASRINQLEMNNARLQRENAEMRIELDEQEGSKVRSLARENTMMADSLLHQESSRVPSIPLSPPPILSQSIQPLKL